MKSQARAVALPNRRQVIGAVLSCTGTALQGQVRPHQRIRLIISSAMVEGLNENDAKAAMKSWAAALVGGTELELEKDHPRIVPSAQVAEVMRTGQADAMAITVREYAQAPKTVVPDSLIVSEDASKGRWRYLLLAHTDSAIRDLAGLKGKSLVLWKHAKTYLAREWLETELHAAGLGPSESHLSRLSEDYKASRGVVLPVFFRQTDVCLIASPTFDEMCELNPQLRRKLRPVATSQNLVTSFFAFHRSLAGSSRRAFVDKVLSLANTPAGQQSLTLFQSARLVRGDIAELEAALNLLARYERLPRGWGRGR